MPSYVREPYTMHNTSIHKKNANQTTVNMSTHLQNNWKGDKAEE